MIEWVYTRIPRLKNGIVCERSKTMKTENDNRQLTMKNCIRKVFTAFKGTNFYILISKASQESLRYLNTNTVPGLL